MDGTTQHPAKGMKLNSIICAVHLGSVAHQGTLEEGTECSLIHTYSLGKYHCLYLPSQQCHDLYEEVIQT